MPKIILLKIKCITVAFIIAAALSACKKKENAYQKPEIIINSPLENQIFKKKDSILVSFSIKHHKPIKKVILYLHNQQNLFFDGSVTFDFNADNITKDLVFPLSDKYKKPGIYYILMKIFDDNEEYNYQHPIQIKEIQQYFNGYLFYNSGGQNLTNCYHIDTNFNITKKIELHQDFLNCYYNKNLQQITLCSEKSGLLQTISSNNFSPIWVVSFPNPYNQPYFTSFFAEEENIIFTTFDEFIKNFRNDGSLRFSSSLPLQQKANSIDINNDYWIVTTLSKTSSFHYLNIFYGLTGELKATLSFTGESLLHAFLKSKTQAIVFSVKNNSTIYYYLNPETNLYSFEGTIGEGIAESIQKIDAQNYVMIINNTLLHFNDYYLHKNIIKSNVNDAKIVMENNTNQAILRTNDSLFFYSLPQFILQKQMSFKHKLLTIHAIYQE